MKKKILIADDEKNVRLLLVKLLKIFNYDIDTVTNGYEAIRQMNKKAYDLIITDYTMPQMDGLELTQRIKSAYPSIPILIITGDGPVQELLENGASACIKKPFNILKFQDIVKNILDKDLT